MLDLQAILVVTKDKHLPKHIAQLGSVLVIEDIADAINIAQEGYDLIILGPPHEKEKAQLIPHELVRVIEKPADLKKVFLEFKNQIGGTEYQSNADNANLPYNEVAEHVLLVTTNINLIKELSCFNLFVATNKYSALKYIENIDKDFSLIIWDKVSVLSKIPKANVPVLVWGEGVKTKEDIYLLLTTGQITLQNKNGGG